MCAAEFSVRFADGVTALKNTCEVQPRVNFVPRQNSVSASVRKSAVVMEAYILFFAFQVRSASYFAPNCKQQ
jgi:hypothetical protein